MNRAEEIMEALGGIDHVKFVDKAFDKMMDAVEKQIDKKYDSRTQGWKYAMNEVRGMRESFSKVLGEVAEDIDTILT